MGKTSLKLQPPTLIFDGRHVGPDTTLSFAVVIGPDPCRPDKWRAALDVRNHDSDGKDAKTIEEARTFARMDSPQAALAKLSSLLKRVVEVLDQADVEQLDGRFVLPTKMAPTPPPPNLDELIPSGWQAHGLPVRVNDLPYSETTSASLDPMCFVAEGEPLGEGVVLVLERLNDRGGAKIHDLTEQDTSWDYENRWVQPVVRAPGAEEGGGTASVEEERPEDLPEPARDEVEHRRGHTCTCEHDILDEDCGWDDDEEEG